MSYALCELISQSFERYSQQTALIQPQPLGEAVQFTYADLAQMAGKVASLLGQTSADECVGIYMQRSAEHVATILASLYSVSPYTTINNLVSSRQICHIVKDSQMKVLFCDNTTLLKLRALTQTEEDQAVLAGLRIVHIRSAAKLPPVHQQTIELLGEYGSVTSVDLTSLAAKPLTMPDPDAVSPAKLILFTSGSTGNPKGVMIRGDDLINRIASESTSYGLQSNDVLLNILPFSFDVGCNQLYCALASGCSLILLNSWMPKDIVNAIVDFKVSGVSGVPSIWLSVINGSQDLIGEVNKALRYITISGGDMIDQDRQKLRALLPDVNIFKTYGQTETFRSGMLLAKDFDEKHRSVGKPVDGVTIYIVDDAGNPVKAGESGQIIHQGTGTMLGYIGDPANTETKLKALPQQLGDASQKVIFTGDLGHLDEDGFLYLHGRQDRMFKVRGNRVYPEEIEKELCEHDDVVEAASSFDKPTEAITVYVKKKEGSSVTDKEVMKFLTAKLPSYMAPAKCLIYDEFPRTASGKIDVPTLVAQAK